MKKTRKVFSLLLSLCMVISMCPPALAEELSNELDKQIENIENIQQEQQQKQIGETITEEQETISNEETISEEITDEEQNIISSEEISEKEDSNDEQEIPSNEEVNKEENLNDKEEILPNKDINNKTNTNVEQEVITNENDEDVKLEENKKQEIIPNEEKENNESNKEESETISNEENNNETNMEEVTSDDQDNNQKFVEEEEEITTTIGKETSGTCGDNLTWTLENGILTISGTGDMDYNYHESPWFDKCKEITTIIMRDGVTSIDAYAFNDCSNLISIEIPDSVTSIKWSAFEGCSSLINIKIPDSVTDIYQNIFKDCSSLVSIEIPNGVTSISSYTFAGCSSLTSIKIPNGILRIDDHAFTGCSSLTSIEIPDSVIAIGTSYMPSDEGYVFAGCSSLISIKIPNGVTSIGQYTFKGCSSLASIEIPDSVTSIGDKAFAGCSNLTSIEIPDSATSIGKSAFTGCSSLTSIEIPNGIPSIGQGTFGGCSNLTHIEIPNSVTSIGGSAFKGCSSLTSIEIPDSVTSIDNHAFEGCSRLTSIEIPDGVTSIGDWAFEYCNSLTKIKIPASVVNIGTGAFYKADQPVDIYYTGTKEQWETLKNNANQYNYLLKDSNIHYNSTGSDDPNNPNNPNPDNPEALNGFATLLTSWNADTREIRFGSTYITLSKYFVTEDAVLPSEDLSNLINKYVWLETEPGATESEIKVVYIQPLDSKLGILTNVSGSNITIDGTIYQFKGSNIPTFPLNGSYDVLYHKLGNDVVSVQTLSKKTGTLEEWDDATKQVKIGKEVFKTNYITDMSFLANFSNMVGWEVDYLFLDGIILRITSSDAEETKTEIKQLERYDSVNNILYFTDGTVGIVADGVTLDTNGLENQWVTCTIQKATEGGHITKIEKLKATASVEVVLNGRDIEYQDEKLRFKGIGDYESKSKFKIPVTIKITNTTKTTGLPSNINNLDLTVTNINVQAPDGFNFGWFGGGVIDLKNPVIIPLNTSSEFSGYMRANTGYKPNSSENEYIVTATVNTDIGQQTAQKAFKVVKGIKVSYNQWEKDFLEQLYKVKYTDGLFQSDGYLTKYFDKKFLEDVSKTVAFWTTTIQSEIAQKTSGKLPKYLEIKHKMNRKNKSHNATIVFTYGSMVNSDFGYGKVYDISYYLIDDETNAILIPQTVYSVSSNADMQAFATGMKMYLAQAHLEELTKFTVKTGASIILDTVTDFSKISDYEYLSSMLDVYKSFGSIIKNAVDFKDFAEQAGDILNNPIDATIQQTSKISTASVKYASYKCPVDVYVYNPDGELCGAIVNNEITTDNLEIFMEVVGSEKKLWMTDKDYSVKLVSTDEGTMDCTIKEFLDGEEKRTLFFYNVPLAVGIEYEEEIPNPINIPTVDYALKSNTGKDILPDRDSLSSSGEDTPNKPNVPDTPSKPGTPDVPSTPDKPVNPDTPNESYIITLAANGGKIDGETMSIIETDKTGKLANLSTPTRTGYTFDGWFTERYNGEEITTETIFTQDTTIYAHWAKNSSNISSGGGGSSSHKRSNKSSSSNSTTGNQKAKVFGNKPGGTIIANNDGTVIITPDDGYQVAAITVNGQSTALPQNNKLSNLTSSDTVNVRFERIGGSVQPPATQPQITSIDRFIDISKTAWYYESVKYVVEQNLFSGVSQKMFAPNDTMTRAMLMTVLARMDGQDVTGGTTWYEKGMNWAKQKQISDGTNPQSDITREQLAAMLFSYANYPTTSGTLSEFTDTNQVSNYAESALCWATENNLIYGKENKMLDPKGKATRAEVAAILMRFCEIMKNQ